MSLTENTTILDKYHIKAKLYEGTISRVWLAEELPQGHNHLVVLKEPLSGGSSSATIDDIGRSFVHELQINTDLQKAGVQRIVPIITFEPFEGKRLLVLKYMQGGNLATFLDEQPGHKVPWKKAVQIALDLLYALRDIHAKQIVHCDLKPANILLDQHEHAYLADFGAAQDIGRTILLSSRVNVPATQATPLYAAPEQIAQNHLPTPATDLYALGCVLFEMVTGQPYKQTPGTKLRALQPSVPEGLEKAVEKALYEPQGERWGSAAQMIAELEKLLPKTNSASSPTAPNLKLTTHALIFHSKSRYTLVWLMTGALLVLIGLAFWWLPPQPQDQFAIWRLTLTAEATANVATPVTSTVKSLATSSPINANVTSTDTPVPTQSTVPTVNGQPPLAVLSPTTTLTFTPPATNTVTQAPTETPASTHTPAPLTGMPTSVSVTSSATATARPLLTATPQPTYTTIPCQYRDTDTDRYTIAD